MTDCPVEDCNAIKVKISWKSALGLLGMLVFACAVIIAFVIPIWSADRDKITDNKQAIAVIKEKFVAVNEKLTDLKKGQLTAEQLGKIVEEAVKRGNGGE